MLKCEVISIGTELLMGQIVNTDAQYISSRLPECGGSVLSQCKLVIILEELRSFEKSFERCDVVITTGGLGSNTRRPYKRDCGGFFRSEISS